jgi:hypothetical protein
MEKRAAHAALFFVAAAAGPRDAPHKLSSFSEFRPMGAIVNVASRYGTFNMWRRH